MRNEAREAERISAEWDGAGDLKRLEEIHAHRPGDARVAALLARARSERNDPDGALAAAGEARAGLGPAAGLILLAEIFLDAGRRAEARALLEEARAAEPGNIAAAGLCSVLDLDDPRRAQAAMMSLPPGAIGCPPVLSRLLLYLEGEMEKRAAGGPTPPGFHQARTALFRPRLDREMFRAFWLEGAGRFLARTEKRARMARKSAVRSALRAGDLAGAAEILAAQPPPGRGRWDPTLIQEERLLALEIAFVLERFGESTRLHRELLKAGGDPGNPYPAALAAYSLLVEGKIDRAREVLAPALEAFRGLADLRHLAALAELKRGSPQRAAAELRRAVLHNDIAMSQLASEEAAYLSRGRLVDLQAHPGEPPVDPPHQGSQRPPHTPVA